MAFVNHFYNSTTRKYVALFGTLFNKISITRDDNDGVEQQRMIVPIAYAPWQKFLSRSKQDPRLDKKSAITLPRMSFEINSLSYDGQRKIASNQKLRKTYTDDGRNFIWSSAPYNLDFSLYIMAKNSEDATKIVEQIIPFFKPEWTSSVKLIPDLEPLDIPLILTSVVSEELYEGDYETRRAVLWTLSFTMKCWYFGPEREKKVIKFVEVDMHTDLDTQSEETISVYPGLTANGEPTTDANTTIPFEDIFFDDDWGVIKVIEESDNE